jgi:hypothetical protein
VPSVPYLTAAYCTAYSTGDTIYAYAFIIVWSSELFAKFSLKCGDPIIVLTITDGSPYQLGSLGSELFSALELKRTTWHHYLLFLERVQNLKSCSDSCIISEELVPGKLHCFSAAWCDVSCTL